MSGYRFIQRADASAILARLAKEGIESLYHFTCVQNLPGIGLNQALCSKGTLEQQGQWPPPVPGGNELSHSLDRQNNNWDKISLNLTPYTPMVYHKKREQHLCFFVINREIATESGVVFTDTNAASMTQQRRSEGAAGLDIINFEAIRSFPRPWDRDGWVRPVQAEVLVPDQILLAYVSEVAFVSSASLAYAEQLYGSHPHPPFIVRNHLFSDGQPQSNVSFAHVIDLVLTDRQIDKNSVQLYSGNQTIFHRSASRQVTFIARIYGMTGTRAGVRWLPIRKQLVTEFQTSDIYYHWGSLSLDELPDGICSLEYHINKIIWASTNFEVTSS